MFGVHSWRGGVAEIDVRLWFHHGHWKKPAHRRGGTRLASSQMRGMEAFAQLVF